jgi:hypothetical protein
MRLRFILICQLSGKNGNLRQFHLIVWVDLEKFKPSNLYFSAQAFNAKK